MRINDETLLRLLAIAGIIGARLAYQTVFPAPKPIELRTDKILNLDHQGNLIGSKLGGLRSTTDFPSPTGLTKGLLIPGLNTLPDQPKLTFTLETKSK